MTLKIVPVYASPIAQYKQKLDNDKKPLGDYESILLLVTRKANGNHISLYKALRPKAKDKHACMTFGGELMREQ